MYQSIHIGVLYLKQLKKKKMLDRFWFYTENRFIRVNEICTINFKL